MKSNELLEYVNLRIITLSERSQAEDPASEAGEVEEAAGCRFWIGHSGFPLAIRTQERKRRPRGGGREMEPLTSPRCGSGAGTGEAFISGLRSLQDRVRSMEGWTKSLSMGSWSYRGLPARPCPTIRFSVLPLPGQPGHL